MCMSSLSHINCSIWLDASQRSWDSIWLNRSAGEVKCKTSLSNPKDWILRYIKTYLFIIKTYCYLKTRCCRPHQPSPGYRSPPTSSQRSRQRVRSAAFPGRGTAWGQVGPGLCEASSTPWTLGLCCWWLGQPRVLRRRHGQWRRRPRLTAGHWCEFSVYHHQLQHHNNNG